MSLWTRLFRWRERTASDHPGEDEPDDAEPEREPDNTIELPAEPYVFECQSCGKVFEARRRRPQCPECDSSDVSLLSE